MTASLQAKSNGTQGALAVNGAEAFSFDASGVDSPFVLTASVAANALTVTLRKGGWRFRNTTLTDGLPVYVKTESDLTLTVAATDSFGAVTAAGTQRIAVLAVNNGGTLQLAASNLAGGVQLDETNRITTATTATTATAIDSTSVATNVAYRVVGYVDVPFTTGTGYGSIVQVQSVGGQALAAMSSLGYGQNWQVVTGSRAASTTYYNTTGKPILVNINSGTAANLVVNGTTVATGTAAAIVNSQAIVPAGGSYSWTGAFVAWSELR